MVKQAYSSDDKDNADVIGKYRLEFERARNHTEEQRDMCNEDIRFVTTPAAQWDGFLSEQFSNRPRFQLDKLSQAVNRFYGEWLTGRATVTYRPENGKAEKEADILSGLYRKDERRCGGDFAVDNAVLEAIRGGMGAYRFSTEYVDEEDTENDDQYITIEPVYSAHASLIWDSNAKRMDKADAKWCYIIHEVDTESLEEQFPDADLSSFTQSNDRRDFNWNSSNNSMFIAERYGVVVEKTKAISYIHPVTGERKTYYQDQIADVMDELSDMGFELDGEKKVSRRYVERCVMGGGSDYLEPPARIAGKNIPVVPLYAYWTYTDGQEFYWGMVRNQKDAQRLLNMQISSLAEIAATSIKQVPIFTPEQVSGHEGNWSQAHLGKKNYQLLNPITDEEGNVVQDGPVGVVSPPIVDPAVGALIEVTGSHIQQETGGNPQNVLDPQASGKAILATQQRVDMQTASIMKNIKKALKRGGEIYRDMAADIYNGPQMMTLLGEDDIESTVMLFEAVMDSQTGNIVEINDITKDKFEVVVDTGPDYASRRQETMNNLLEMLGVVGNMPQGESYIPAIMGMIIENTDGTNLDDLKEFNNKQMMRSGFREPKSDEDKAFMQQLQQEQAQNQEQNPMVLAAQAEMMKGQADMLSAQNKQAANQINMFKAETERMELGVDAQVAGVKIENTQADTMNKRLDGMGKMIDNGGKRMEVQRRLLQPIGFQ